jgi:hypothetical protein
MQKIEIYLEMEGYKAQIQEKLVKLLENSKMIFESFDDEII